MIAFSRSATLLKTPRRMRCSVISAKKRSTKLSQEAEVGVRQMEARMRREPAPDLGRLVGGAVVDDQVQVEIRRCLLVDAFQKAQEFAMPMAGQAFADDHPGQHVERGEQGGGAVTFVVVGHGPDRPFLIGNPGWVRSSAWIWLFSSTDSTSALSGGSR